MLTKYDVWKTIFMENDIDEIKNLLDFILDDEECSKYVASKIVSLKNNNVYNINVNYENFPDGFPIEELQDEIASKIINFIKMTNKKGY